MLDIHIEWEHRSSDGVFTEGWEFDIIEEDDPRAQEDVEYREFALTRRELVDFVVLYIADGWRPV